ncbi:formylglycine-generating enzyme family protein [Candidatus Poribacteria bacterium]|nr:formylglycine-generating enzyme family protein [Candidatus Poribacteria bacterium]
MTMALVPAGAFLMGSTEDEPGAVFQNEMPRHAVCLGAYEIDCCLVTNADWARYARLTGARLPAHWGRRGFDGPDQPVIGVTWTEASQYAAWVGKRLPTEAEWERAARADRQESRFPWGDAEPTHALANYDQAFSRTTPVGSYPPNAFGLFDMAGNVWEWCADGYASDAYGNRAPEGEPVRNPLAAEPSSRRVVRGGSWQSFGSMLRCGYRGFLPATTADPSVGFRCVRNVVAG